MTTLATPATLPTPASHLDLLTRPICGVLTTMGQSISSIFSKINVRLTTANNSIS